MILLVDNAIEIYQFTILLIFTVAVIFFLAMYWYAQSLEKSVRSEEKTRQELIINSLDLDRSRLRNTILEAEAQAENERNLRLEQEAMSRSNELVYTTMMVSQHQKLLSDIDSMILSAASDPQHNQSDLHEIRKKIRSSAHLEEGWRSFQEQFSKVHPEFVQYLQNQHPKLTQNDIRHCAYIKMRLNTKEIAQLMNINPTSVQIARVRLKKKMNLGRESDLIQYIANL